MTKLSLLALLLSAAPSSLFAQVPGMQQPADRAYLAALADQIRTARNTTASRDLINQMIKNKISVQEDLTQKKRAEALAQAIRLSGRMKASPKTTQELELALKNVDKKEEVVVKMTPSSAPSNSELAEAAPIKDAVRPPWLTADYKQAPVTEAPMETVASLNVSSEEMRDALKDAPAKKESVTPSVWISTHSSVNGRKR